MITNFFKESIFMILALFAGFISFKKGINPAYRVLWLQVCIACAVEFAGAWIAFKGHENTWLYDCYLPVEFYLQLSVAVMIWPVKKITRAAIICSLVYAIGWCIEFRYNRFTEFYNLLFTAEALMLIFFYLHVLYRAGYHRSEKILKFPELWLTLAVLLSYGMLIFFFNMLKYSGEHLSKADYDLLSETPLVSGNVGYALICLCFIVLYFDWRNKLKITR